MAMRSSFGGSPIGSRLRQNGCFKEQGFILPMAIGSTLLLLLGSLSIQTVVLQGHLGQASREDRGRQEDALATAAQQLVGVINLRHPCLLVLPLTRWSQEGLPCASGPEQAALLRGEGGGSSWRLLDWRSSAAGAEALIELDAAPAGGTPRRAAFAVALLAEPLRAQPPRFLGLRGVEP
jgi:hypothetical protein